MTQTSKPRPIISLTALGGAVRTSENGKHTYLDVTFKCAFAADEEGIGGSDISIGSGEMYSVAQLAQTAYIAIVKLLADQEEQQPDDEGRRER
jgi:hypothetical protein